MVENDTLSYFDIRSKTTDSFNLLKQELLKLVDEDIA